MSNSLKKILTIAIAVVVVGLGAFLFGKQLKATDDSGEYVDAPVIEVAVDEVVIEEIPTEEQTETSEELVAEAENADEEYVPEVVEEETEEPAETEEVTESAEEAVTEQETEPEVVNRKVEIWTDRKPFVKDGDAINLFSKLTGFDGVEVKYQWQVNKGNGFEDIPGANSDTYTYSASKESLSWTWRLMINY